MRRSADETGLAQRQRAATANREGQMTLTEVVITLPLPPRELSQNARCVSWRKGARAAKLYRRDAYLCAVAVVGYDLGWPAAVARAVFYWPTRRRRDLRNAEAMLKPAYDGIVDAKLIPDDNVDFLTHEPTVFDFDKRDPRVEIRLRRCDAKRDGATI